MPLWNLLAGWCSLSVLLFGHSWDRHNSKLGILGELATYVTEYVFIIGAEI